MPKPAIIADYGARINHKSLIEPIETLNPKYSDYEWLANLLQIGDYISNQ